MPFTAAQFLCALMLPAALAALLTCCARDLRARPSSAHMGLGGVMLLLTIAVAHAASAMAVGASLMPPLMGWNWLPWMALAAVPLFVFAMPSRLTESPLPASIFQHAWRWCAVAATTACGAWVLLRPFEITNEFTYLHLAGGIAAAAMLAIATGIVSSSADRHPFTDRITSIICSGGITLGILVTGSVNMALLAGIVPLAILGGGLAAWVTDRGSWSAAHRLGVFLSPVVECPSICPGLTSVSGRCSPWLHTSASGAVANRDCLGGYRNRTGTRGHPWPASDTSE